MPRLVYACRFDVEGATLNDLHQAYATWIEHHYHARRSLPGFALNWNALVGNAATPIEGHELGYAFFDSGKGKVCRINWGFPDDDDSAIRWQSAVTLGETDQRVCVEHLVSVESTDYFVAPARLILGSPGVVRQLCATHTVRVAEMRLRAEPYSVELKNAGQFLGLLRSPLRRLPIVFLTPYASMQPNLIDADALAKRLAGVAIVVRADDDVTWTIGDSLGRPLSCFDGGARIYWPGFQNNDHPRTHPLFLGTRIELQGGQAISGTIERLIFGVACFRFVPDPEMLAVIRSVEGAARATRLESQKVDSGISWQDYALELDEKLSDAGNRVAELEAENANLKANQSIIFSSPETGTTELAAAAIAPSLTNVNDAVVQAGQVCRNLIILPSALKASEQSPFLRPQEIKEALEDLNEVAIDWAQRRQSKGSGGDLLRHLSSRGWGKRCSMHISDQARARYGSEYSFEYQGRKQLFEPHITLGSGAPNSCASIHFILDEEKEKIVVAHVGRHLSNTKT